MRLMFVKMCKALWLCAWDSDNVSKEVLIPLTFEASHLLGLISIASLTMPQVAETCSLTQRFNLLLWPLGSKPEMQLAPLISLLYEVCLYPCMCIWVVCLLGIWVLMSPPGISFSCSSPFFWCYFTLYIFQCLSGFSTQ